MTSVSHKLPSISLRRPSTDFGPQRALDQPEMVPIGPTGSPVGLEGLYRPERLTSCLRGPYMLSYNSLFLCRSEGLSAGLRRPFVAPIMTMVSRKWSSFGLAASVRLRWRSVFLRWPSICPRSRPARIISIYLYLTFRSTELKFVLLFEICAVLCITPSQLAKF